MKLSALNRTKNLANLSSQNFDLIIIGGGITGAGIALDASLRGLKCALFEMQDFSAGTSSRSTKLVHGGLRYLKQLEVSLVREVGLERAIVHRNARHVVRAEKMLLPIVKNGSLGKFSSSVGLAVYDFLADVKKSERRKMLSKKATVNAEPLLEKENLIGGGLYFEYRSDDARLTIEIMKSAVKHGAVCFNYTKVEDFIYKKDENNDDVIAGVKISDLINEKQLEISAKRVVNAAGPWVDKLRNIDGSLEGKRLQHTKGIHLVFDKEKLPVQQANYFDVGDGRMVFAIPREEIVYVGTTDTIYTAQIARPKVSKADVDYVLTAVNKMFPSANLKAEDIISTWAGLRPLIHEDGKSPSELSRKDEIFYSDSGLVSIAGGKLTGYRKMAERTVDVVVKSLKKQENLTFAACATEKERLSGGDFNCEKCLAKEIKATAEVLANYNLSEQKANRLVFKYGSNTAKVLEKLENLNAKYANLPTDEQLMIAELHYGIENEMVCNLSDFLVRRTGRLYFERPIIAKHLANLNTVLAETFAWNEAQKQASLADFMQEYDEVLTFFDKAVDLKKEVVVA